LLDGHAAGFNLRDVEDVVDDKKEGVGEVGDDHEVFALLTSEVRLEGDASQTDDAAGEEPSVQEKRERKEESAPVHRRTNLVRHVSEELGFRPVRKLSRLPRHRVLLQRVAKGEDHLVDLGLERVHLSARFDGDEGGEVSFGCGGGNLGEGANLRGQVKSHGVDVRLRRRREINSR
jgi:hypothetical protein